MRDYTEYKMFKIWSLFISIPGKNNIIKFVLKELEICFFIRITILENYAL